MTATTPRKPELLAPAGTLKALEYALAYGADAVYAGVPRYSLRVRNNDFDLANLGAGIETAHGQDRRFYVAANALPHGAKVKTFLDDMAPVVALSPDALIMADPGLILLVRERWPELPVHLSVQANTTNAAAVRFWQQQGITRVILSRELSLAEIAEIRAACPEIELEVFVHGAVCIAYSGRCLLSGYFNHRDANQGSCTNACRWEYRLVQPMAAADDSASPAAPGTTESDPSAASLSAAAALGAEGAHAQERHRNADEVWLLEEARRPCEYMPVLEDEQGTYILNAKDLRAVQHVAALAAMGIDCLKIEGRTKSHYYAARTARVYRQAIDDAAAGRPFRHALMDELEGLANRGYTDGFYRRQAGSAAQNYSDGASRSHRRIFVGEVIGPDTETGLVQVAVKNRFAVGDELELITPGGLRRWRLEAMLGPDGAPLRTAPGDGWRVRLPLPWPQARLGLLAATI
ncbi:U32 family peptidase [Thiohalocapsa halophila]|uniref:U32 family peptidase n=1 Tax=Thiohalocapsa halophila TaxID=69359 RepID=A0ABS1CMU7_9GAMM|nr:tRNA 5-hydroxyuridine modification protein YegQ [Thiohalocapsa halophila]MBK1633164.1 U32 family peptidase [Thiohalocapsa halophila]